MRSPALQHISSRENALFKSLKRLAQDNTAYRKQGCIWVEGDHLCRCALQHGLRPAMAVFAQSCWPRAVALLGQAVRHVPRTIVLDDALMNMLGALESPAPMAFVLDLPRPAAAPQARAPSVVLDRLQDAGNVGSVLRSASAFGFRQIIALKGTAALWSTKVLRAGMGAHFALHLIENAGLDAVRALQCPLLLTSSHEGRFLHTTTLPWPCAWVMGNEGQGVGDALAALAHTPIRIAQPGGEESLNVAAAAAICLHHSATQKAGMSPHSTGHAA